MSDRRRLACSTLLLVAACGGAERPPPAAEATRAEPATEETSRQLVAAHGLTEAAYTEGSRVLELLVQAAFTAAARTPDRAVPRSGTIVIQGSTALYASVPNDRLEIEVGAERWGFEVLEADSRATSAEAFFDADHRLRVVATSATGESVELSTTRSGERREAHIAGRLSLHDRAYDLDLTWVGTERFESDSTGTHHIANLTVAGWVVDADLELVVSESWAFELVAGAGRDGFVAQTAVRKSDGRLTTHAHRYDLTGVETRRAFRDGKPTEVDTYWSARGHITKDGQPWGELELDPYAVVDNGGVVQFSLRTPTEVVVLESYAAY